MKTKPNIKKGERKMEYEIVKQNKNVYLVKYENDKYAVVDESGFQLHPGKKYRSFIMAESIFNKMTIKKVKYRGLRFVFSNM